MHLSLSSAALPAAPISKLRHAARRREFEGLELVVDEDHESGPSCSSLQEQTAIEEGTPPVRWVLLEKEHSLAEVLYWSRQAHLLEAGVILQRPIPESPLCIPLALWHSTEPESAHRAVSWARLHDAQTCWEVEIGRVREAKLIEVLNVTAPMLAHVRLVGAGPEEPSRDSEAVGTGDVLRVLALSGYSGTVALAPSGSNQRSKWRRWLFDERGWGCNTAAKKKAGGSAE